MSCEKVINNEEFYRDLANTTEDIVFCIDGKGLIIYKNRIFKDVLRYDGDDLDVVFDKEESHILKKITETTYDLQLRLKCQGEKENYIEIIGNIYVENSCKKAIFKILSEGYHIKNKLHKENSFLKKITDNLSDLVAITDLNLIYQWVGKSHEILGYKDEDIIGHSALEFIHPEDYKLIKEIMEKNKLKNLKSKSMEYRMKNSKGIYLWFETIGKTLYEGDKKIGYLFNTRDISRHKELEKELRESEQGKLALIQSINDLVFVFDKDLICKECHTPDSELLLIKEEMFLNKYIGDIYFPEPAKTDIIKALVDGKKTGEETFVEYSININDEEKWFHADINKLKTLTGSSTDLLLSVKDITEQKKVYDLLRKNKKDLERFFQISLDLLCIADMEGRFIKINDAWKEILGYESDDMVGVLFLDYIHPDDIESTCEVIDKLLNNKKPVDFVNRFRTYYGEYRYIEWKAMPYEDKVYASARDISDHIIMEKTIYLEKEQLRTTLMSVGDGVISTDNKGRIISMNRVAEALTGWNAIAAKGNLISNVFKLRHNKKNEENIDPVEAVLKSGEIRELESDWVLINKNEKEINIEDSISLIRDNRETITGAVVVFRNTTEKYQKQQEIEYLSFHDPLTGLYNRRYFEDSIKRVDTLRNIPFTVMVMDVNGLKLINDIYGHDAGDKLLKDVANIFNKSFRSDDIIARTGGDEFAVLLPNTDEDTAEGIKERILKNSNKYKNKKVIISIAVGYSTKKEETEDIWICMKKADKEMYKDKVKNGRDVRKRIVDIILENQKRSDIDDKVKYSLMISDKLDVSEEIKHNLELLSRLCDIGEISVPNNILKKKDAHTKDERELYHTHSKAGFQILRSVDEYISIDEAVLYHHENWDGSGYPKGLKGNSIPIESRIIAVVNSFIKLKENNNSEVALNKIKELEGKEFDPGVVKILEEIVKESGE